MMATITILAVAFIAGLFAGYLVKALDTLEVAQAGADELALLRRQVKELTEENIILREEYADYSWIEQEWMLAGRVE